MVSFFLDLVDNNVVGVLSASFSVVGGRKACCRGDAELSNTIEAEIIQG